MPFRSWLTGNLGVKISSLVLAFIVWIMVQGEITTKRVFHDVPYELEVASSMVVTQKDVDALRVTVSGPQEAMRDMVENSIRVKHDLKGIEKPGVVQFDLSPEDFKLSPRIQILDIYPNRLSVTLDFLIEKELPVKAHFVGKPERGFRVKDFVANPTVVKVIGPKQRLEKLMEIETLPILLTGRTRSFVQGIALKPLLSDDPRVELQHVDVYTRIEPDLAKRTLGGVTLSLLEGPKARVPVRFVKDEIEVTLEGSSDILEKMHASDLKAYVDVMDLKPGKYQLPVNVLPVRGLNVVESNPRVVEVEISEELVS
ncbi:MAG: hypothetical protein HYS08_02660 [Chlamydiae bacterium]|nr:hypothetical protein [Chlamydiota bacterium]MBI3266632.1 hypothetical protein [Chlamydiota bacterium]